MKSKAFTIWTNTVIQTVANDGLYNYGISLDSVVWQQPMWGGMMRLFYRESGEIGIGSHLMGRRDG